MNGGRGAKGSINDRLISMLYRKRYKEYMKKLESYNKADRTKKKEYLIDLKEKVDIDDPMDDLDIEDRKELEDIFKDLKVEDLLEVFDTYLDDIEETIEKNKTSMDLSSLDQLYSNIDMNQALASIAKESYYELINNKTSVGTLDQDEVLDIDNEITKADDELTIIEEMNDFISDSLELLSEIKSEITNIKLEINEQHTQEDINKLNERYLRLKEKVTLLKEQYLVVSEKYDFEDFEILDNIKMMDAIEDYKSLASLEELELLSDACKEEIEAIDGILIEEKRRVGIEEEIENKKDEIVTRDNDFDKSKMDTMYYSKFEKEISKEIELQKQAIAEFWVGLSKVDTELVTTHDYIYHTNKMFGSFLRIASGILTLPFSNLFGMSLGTNLINRGVKELRKSMIPEKIERQELVTHYTSIEDDIRRARDSVDDAKKLLDDTIDQIDKFEKEFKEKFSQYAEYIPDYYKIANQIETLNKQLRYKKEETKQMEETLSKQYENNKQKVLRAR